MAAAQGEDERFDGDHACPDLPREWLDPYPDNAYVNVAVGECVEQRLVVSTGECDLDRGVGTVESPERLGEAVVDWPRDADPQSAVEHPAQRGDRVAASLRRRQRCAGVGQKRLARFGKADRAPIARKERFAELALKATDLCADRRLSDRDPHSGARELPFIGHGDEVRELLQVHNEAL
jgi:hypothetical protein